ncbi:hypothetical protein [Pseudomonas sp. NPDC088444]|uniref:hypothetical protein n=1 Tax=Pseudomonas sp. NPDC088444 TaxID=3364456 RepID=UPI003850B5FA
MSDDLTEEEMRQALFGPSSTSSARPSLPASALDSTPARAPTPGSAPEGRAFKARSSRLRVTLQVSKAFEGQVEVFTYDASTLSTLLAEQEAKAAAKKKKYRYFEVVSILPVEH